MQKVTQAVEYMYTSQLFWEENMINWDKTWTSFKGYSKELYMKQKRYNKTMRKFLDSKARQTWGRIFFLGRQNQGNVRGTEWHIQDESRANPTGGNDKWGHDGVMTTAHRDGPGATKSDHKTYNMDITTHKYIIIKWNQTATTIGRKKGED